MLAIRLQRLGRKGYPVYRVVVQESQRHPSSGRIVAYAGSYNPHTKQTKLDKEKIELYLSYGAQPSPHVIKLLVQEKISLPDWVSRQGKKEKKIRNPEKLRKNRPAEPKPSNKKPEVKSEAPAEAIKSDKNDDEDQPNENESKSEAKAKDATQDSDEETRK